MASEGSRKPAGRLCEVGCWVIGGETGGASARVYVVTGWRVPPLIVRSSNRSLEHRACAGAVQHLAVADGVGGLIR
jgi:hypothetical protein